MPLSLKNQRNGAGNGPTIGSLGRTFPRVLVRVTKSSSEWEADSEGVSFSEFTHKTVRTAYNGVESHPDITLPKLRSIMRPMPPRAVVAGTVP
jgi:hypothetical protein